MSRTEEHKRRAAHRAVTFVRSGMILGLGHGSTAAFALEKLAELIASGELTDVLAIPCSKQVEAQARQLGIPLTTLDAHSTIDLTIDGADEVDPHLNLIKGGGGALLREKVVACASQREIIIADGTKLSECLGTRFALPVEVVPFAWTVVKRSIESFGATVVRRGGDIPFLTDQGNYILDCRFPPIADPAGLADQLSRRPGVVEHGLFIGLATDLIVADEAGVRHVTRSA